MRTTKSQTERGKAREKNTGMTQREIAEMIGCSRSKIHHFETGHRPGWTYASMEDRKRVDEILNWAYGNITPDALEENHDPSPLEVVEWRVVYAKLEQLAQEETPALTYFKEALGLLNEQSKRDGERYDSLMAEVAINRQRDLEWIGTCSVMEGQLKEMASSNATLIQQNQTLTLAATKAQSELDRLRGVEKRNHQLEQEESELIDKLAIANQRIKELESQPEKASIFKRMFGDAVS